MARQLEDYRLELLLRISWGMHKSGLRCVADEERVTTLLLALRLTKTFLCHL